MMTKVKTDEKNIKWHCLHIILLSLHSIFVVSPGKDAELEEKEDLFELDMESSDAGAR